MSAVALLGSGERAVRAACASGLQVLLCPVVGRPNPAAEKLADGVVRIDLNDVEQVATRIDDTGWRHRLDAVFSFTEHGLAPAAELAHQWGLRGQPVAAVKASRDKWLMRQRLAGSTAPVAAALVRTAAEVSSFAARYGWPVMVKDRAGVGKSGVWLVRDSTTAASIPYERGPLLAEEYLPGPEVSVECITVGRYHRVVAITGKTVHTRWFTELAHVVPAPLAAPAAELVAATAIETLTTLGVDDAISHTEVKLTPTGPRVVETHTRPGGDRIVDLVRHATGVDVYQTFFYLIRGQAVAPGRVSRSAAVRFLTPRPGTVVAVAGASAARAMPGVLEVSGLPVPGQHVVPATRNAHRCGLVIATGPDAATALAVAEDSCRRIRVKTRRVSGRLRPVLGIPGEPGRRVGAGWVVRSEGGGRYARWFRAVVFALRRMRASRRGAGNASWVDIGRGGRHAAGAAARAGGAERGAGLSEAGVVQPGRQREVPRRPKHGA